MQLKQDTQSRFTPDPGKVPEGEVVYCGVCKDAMKETRNVNGARGFAMAMTGSKALHDVFECPNRKEDWHCQVIALRTEARASVSSFIEEILLEEAEQVLSERKATKKISSWRYS
jgi:hypothetical protein